MGLSLTSRASIDDKALLSGKELQITTLVNQGNRKNISTSSANSILTAHNSSNLIHPFIETSRMEFSLTGVAL